MIGMGREPQKDKDLFFTCSLIDYIARKTKNIRADVVNQLGKERLERIYDLADVYHCDNIDQVSDDFIEEAQIKNGTFDNVGECKYAIPSHAAVFYFIKFFRYSLGLHPFTLANTFE